VSKQAPSYLIIKRRDKEGNFSEEEAARAEKELNGERKKNCPCAAEKNTIPGLNEKPLPRKGGPL